MKVLRRALVALVGIGLAAGVGLVTVGPADAAPSKKVTWNNAKVIRWKDGDTVVTSRGTIRLIGVDTPEKGRCGAATATKWAKKWAPVGSTVRLGNPKSVKDKDRYGRSLRYVYVASKHIDVSKSQIVKGSKARYDSTDGYQWHPRQSSYHKADRDHRNYSCKKKPGGGFSTRPIGHRLPEVGPDQGQRAVAHLPHAGSAVLQDHRPGDLLQHRGRGAASRVPQVQDLTTGTSRDGAAHLHGTSTPYLGRVGAHCGATRRWSSVTTSCGTVRPALRSAGPQVELSARCRTPAVSPPLCGRTPRSSSRCPGSGQARRTRSPRGRRHRAVRPPRSRGSNSAWCTSMPP